MTLHQLKRILQLDGLLRDPQRRNTHESLAAALDRDNAVDPRIIRKDLSFLKKDCGAPIIYNTRRGHHYSDPDWQLNQILITEGDLLALVVTDRLLETYADSPYIRQLRSGLRRLSERLDSKVAIEARELRNDYFLFQSKADLNLDLAVVSQLERACRDGYSAEITYHTANRDVVSDRVVDPYGMLVQYNALQLLAFCHQRQKVITFRVDRIKQLRVTEQRFETLPGFSLKAYMATAFRWEVGDAARRVVVEFDRATAPFVRGRQWHSTQGLTDLPGGGLLLSMEVSGLRDVAQWVLSYGKGAIVREPPELVRAIAREVEIMQRQSETETFER